jgi:hypothetical protein
LKAGYAPDSPLDGEVIGVCWTESVVRGRCFAASRRRGGRHRETVPAVTTGEYRDFMSHVTHVVLVSWASGLTTEAEESIRSAIRNLGETIPGIGSLVEGHSSSPEGLENGHDYGFVVTFDDANARDSYVTDPRHRVVADVIGRSAQRIVAFDI